MPKIPENSNEFQWNADPLVPDSANPKEDAARLIRAFLPRAFRRAVSEEVQQHYVQPPLAVPVYVWDGALKNYGPNLGYDYGGRLQAAWLER